MSKDNTLTATYQGIKIAYDENNNKFVFELRGRERSVDSLREAKDAIDKPEPKHKQPFTRIQCWYRHYSYGDGEPLKKVEVTSLVQGRHGQWREAWIMDGKERSKVMLSSLYPVGVKNDAVAANIIDLAQQMSKLALTQGDLFGKLTPMEEPTDE